MVKTNQISLSVSYVHWMLISIPQRVFQKSFFLQKVVIVVVAQSSLWKSKWYLILYCENDWSSTWIKDNIIFVYNIYTFIHTFYMSNATHFCNMWTLYVHFFKYIVWWLWMRKKVQPAKLPPPPKGFSFRFYDSTAINNYLSAKAEWMAFQRERWQ